MVISTDAEKAFNKIQHLSMIKKKKQKTSQQTRNSGKSPQLDKEHLQNT